MATTMSEIRANGSLWWRIHVFTYDLRNFRERPDSLNRLDSIVDSSYLGAPYFSAQEVSQLKKATTPDGKTLEQSIQETLDERLERRIKKRQESEDYRVCAAHDLAPIFEKAFNLDHKKLAKDQDFLKLVDERGLRGGEDWTGLAAKPKCGKKTPPGKKQGRR